MTATSTIAIGSNVIHGKESLDPRVFSVIDEIENDETYQRIVSDLPYGLDDEDVLLIARLLNACYPPTDPCDVAECLGDGTFTVIVNPNTDKLEWESSSTRFAAVGEWTEGDNAFGYRPPDRILMEAMSFDGALIRHVENPTEEMKLAAVRRTSTAIRYIKNPSEAVRRAAAITATAERPRVRAAFAREYGPDVTPTDALLNDGTPCREKCDCGFNASQDVQEYWVQGIRPLNLISNLLICNVMELNSRVENNERAADFVHLSEIDGGLVLSFSTMQQLFLMRDMFEEDLEMEYLDDQHGMDFEDMKVLAYPSALRPGLVTWGSVAKVTRD